MQTQFKAILPPKVNVDAIWNRLEWAVDQTAKEAMKDFEATCDDFEHKPTFTVTKYVGANAISFTISTDDENYKRLNNGVEGGYKIPKAGPGLLVFQPGYKSKTVPGVLKSRQGGAYGDVVFVNTQITAKGFEGRHFDVLVRNKNEPWLKQRTRVAMREAARASGHGAP